MSSSEMKFRKRLAAGFLKVTGWEKKGEPAPSDRVMILVAAPHTSGWDYPLMLAMAWLHDIQPRFLAKKELFEGPLGPIMRRTGGIPVDRDNPGDLVDQLVARVKSGEAFHLVIPAEGTRKKRDYWKSGFYRIAQQSGVPFVLTYLDGPTKTTGFGPKIMATGDVRADMDKVRAFYADKHGVTPELRTEPRLREEDAASDDASADDSAA